MSYILEALKKSDRERRQGEIPGLQSDHGQLPEPREKEGSSGFRLWIVAVIVLAGLGAALAFSWGTHKNDAALREKITALEKSVGQLREQPEPAVAAGKAAESHDTGSVTTAPGPETGTPERTAPLPEVHTALPAPEQQEALAPDNIAGDHPPEAALSSVMAAGAEPDGQPAESLPLIQDLPAAVRKRLPPIQLAGHVFAEDGAKRMIIINNRICREGDMVEDGLYLDRIIWEGVILRYQQICFRMKLL